MAPWSCYLVDKEKLGELAAVYPERWEEIKAALRVTLDDRACIRRMIDSPKWNDFYSTAKNCQNYAN